MTLETIRQKTNVAKIFTQRNTGLGDSICASHSLVIALAPAAPSPIDRYLGAGAGGLFRIQPAIKPTQRNPTS